MIELHTIFDQLRSVKARRPEPETMTILTDRKTAATFASLYAKAVWRYWNHMRRSREWLKKGSPK